MTTTNILFTAAIVIIMILFVLFVIYRADKEVAENENKWYDIMVHRVKHQLNDIITEYSYEIEVRNNSTKQRLIKVVLNENEFISFKNFFNIEPLEFVNNVSYYVFYAHKICDKITAFEIIEYLKNNYNPKTMVADNE